MKICIAFNVPEGSNISEILNQINSEMTDFFGEESKMLDETKEAFSTEVGYELFIPSDDSTEILKTFFENLDAIFRDFSDYRPRFVKYDSRNGSSIL